jgi:phosphoribosylamine--glycine ligase
MNKLKILIIGGGGREHAIGWKIAQSERAGEIFFAPGNGGTSKIGKNLDIKATEIDKLLEFAIKEKIDITLAIPDDPLALGVVDLFRSAGMKIFGPTKKAAQLESSKAFAKNFMSRHNLPTAKFQTFTDFNLAKDYINELPLPIVVKASGLALGKGVVICNTKDEALTALENMMNKKIFGEAGSEVVVEEFLTGPEISTHAFSDGSNYSFFPTSQDHKRVGEGDTGENTGGMGTIAPLPFVSENLREKILDIIVKPTLLGMKDDGNIFEGVLYPGLMLTENGPKILEYNARFGDPETQTYMRLLDSDLLEIIEACIDKKLGEIEINWKQQSACTIVLASGGYPASHEKGKIISGIDEAEKMDDIVVFHAGTTNMEGNLVTNGGRVLGVSATGTNLEEALGKAYKAVAKISFEGMQYRRDIGKKALLIK